MTTEMLNPAKTSPGRRHRRHTRKRSVVAGVALLLAGAGFALWPTRVVYQPMQSSYAFDVTNLRILSGQADNIVIAQVLGISGVDQVEGRTSFTVDVVDAIKGDLDGRQVVEQLGFVEKGVKKRTIIEQPDQPLLKPDTQVLLTLGLDQHHRHVVMAGPRSVVLIAEGTQRSELREERANAARNALPVKDQNGRIVLLVKVRPVR